MKFTVNAGERLHRNGQRYAEGDTVEMTQKEFEAQPSLARVLSPAKPETKTPEVPPASTSGEKTGDTASSEKKSGSSKK